MFSTLNPWEKVGTQPTRHCSCSACCARPRFHKLSPKRHVSSGWPLEVHIFEVSVEDIWIGSVESLRNRISASLWPATHHIRPRRGVSYAQRRSGLWGFGSGRVGSRSNDSGRRAGPNSPEKASEDSYHGNTCRDAAPKCWDELKPPEMTCSGGSWTQWKTSLNIQWFMDTKEDLLGSRLSH